MSQLRTMTVITHDDQFGGALAYALQTALYEPARVRVVHVGTPADLVSSHFVPLPVQSMAAEVAAAVLGESEVDDVIVVQGPHDDDEMPSPVRSLLARAPCLVVEVDEQGELVRASGPGGWSYSAA
jgi:hypothetical protein